MKNKKCLRQKIKEKIKFQKDSERRKKSRKIIKQLFTLEEFKRSRCIMLYVSRGRKEVETGPIIKESIKLGKKVVLPKTLVKEKRILPVLYDPKDALKKGPYGIFEPEVKKRKRPVDIKNIDLVIVPGVAFDKDNHRLGHGEGYYDRFLSRLDNSIPKVGIGFKFQQVERIPKAAHDVRLTKVLTD